MVDVAAGVELVRGLKRDELRDVLLLIGVVNLLLQIVQIGHVPVTYVLWCFWWWSCMISDEMTGSSALKSYLNDTLLSYCRRRDSTFPNPARV
ncbi:hypothetical protein PRIPAC_87049 [Pristionchus pacificus]|uniref:Uncharacterized protein n=1 Tax=Pristionchus pacificus TaxID=54126 RepID=A0A2A6BSR5_PRIPA|nr:hypothetical protein PRIPAC_87049 [Pristionchus pacificus]|eukprot:PDM68928.1 hypothetical protein PRIPAC_47230 [Pristionchus pacificus]